MERVLFYVEDNREVASLVMRTLLFYLPEDLSGRFTTRQAASFKEALSVSRTFQQGAQIFLLTDGDLPDGFGGDLVKELKRMEQQGTIRCQAVIFSGTDYREVALEVGALCALIKAERGVMEILCDHIVRFFRSVEDSSSHSRSL